MGTKIKWHELIRELLEISSERQSTFGERFNVNQQTVSNWVTGCRTPSLDTRPAILEYCKTLNVDPFLFKDAAIHFKNKRNMKKMKELKQDALRLVSAIDEVLEGE